MSTISFDSQGREIVEPPQTEGAKKFVCRVCGRDAQRVSGGWSCNHGEEQEWTELKTKVFEALGEASMQWGPRPSGVFDSTECGKVGERLWEQINAALAAERQRYDDLQRSVVDLSHPNCKQLLNDVAAERQLREQAEKERNKWRKDFANIVEDRRQIRQQLLSAQAAIERAIIHDQPPTLCQEKLDLRALHEHDAKVREPLVEELENIRNANPEMWRKTFGDDVFRQFTMWVQNRAARVLDELEKVKEK